MYCTYCNHKNAEGNKFCESCGKPLVTTDVSAPISAKPVAVESKKEGKSSWLRRIPSIGAALVIICFFLPWVMVSCSYNLGTQNKIGYGVTGFEIASGSYPIMDVPEELKLSPLFWGSVEQTPSDTDAYPLLALIPVLGLIGLFSLTGRLSGTILAIISGILGILGMLVFSLGIIYVNSKISITGFRLEFQSGLLGTWIGFLWQTITGMMTVKH